MAWRDVLMRNFTRPCKQNGKSWKDWNPTTHIKERISDDFLTECRKMLWKRQKVFEAAESGDEQTLAFAVLIAESVAQLNTLNETNQSVMHQAVRTCSPELCHLLRDRGCNPNVPDHLNETPLHLAIKAGRPDNLRSIIYWRANFDDDDDGRDTNTEQQLYYPLPEYLCRVNVAFYCHNSEGLTPIHLTARTPHCLEMRVCFALLYWNVSMNVSLCTEKDMQTVLHIAANNNDPEMVYLAIMAGVSVKATDIEGKKASDVIKEKGYEDVKQAYMRSDYFGIRHRADYAGRVMLRRLLVPNDPHMGSPLIDNLIIRAEKKYPFSITEERDDFYNLWKEVMKKLNI